jgi:hypothetical protein
MFVKSYFWRTYNGVELDYIEKKTNELFAYEIKYTKPKLKAPKSWVDNYGSNYQCITKENVLEFLL